MNRVVIAGAGIAGLSIAHALVRESPDTEIVVLEAREQPGGNIRSERVDGYLCEWGPDGFLDNSPATLDLVREIGLADRLAPSSPSARRRFIYRKGRLVEVPTSPGAFVTSSLLSVPAKARLVMEPFSPGRPSHDESIHDFAARRIGREAAEVMVGSMVSGIFAGDAHALSLQACFPKMWEMETEYRSLVRALLAKRKTRRKDSAVGAPAGVLTSFKGGMQELTDRLAASLDGSIRMRTPVLAVRERATNTGPRPVGARRFGVVVDGRSIEADALVLAGPASESGNLLRTVDAPLSGLVAGIETAPLAVVCLGYDAAALAADRGPLDGFGFLVPRAEGPRILGALWETSIYEDRAPSGKALIRVMIGGATDIAAVALDDDALVGIVRRDLERTMGLRIAPEFVRIVRHARGIPQYTIGHPGRMARIDTLLQGHPGLFLAGNSYRGISVNACIADAPALARRVASHLRFRTPQVPYRLAR